MTHVVGISSTMQRCLFVDYWWSRRYVYNELEAAHDCSATRLQKGNETELLGGRTIKLKVESRVR